MVVYSVNCRLRWAPAGLSLASASDDRTVRLWDLQRLFTSSAAAAQPGSKPSISQAAAVGQRGSSTAGETDVAEPRLVLRGHSTRLWDVAFAGDVLVTASEDCTARCGSSFGNHPLSQFSRG